MAGRDPHDRDNDGTGTVGSAPPDAGTGSVGTAPITPPAPTPPAPGGLAGPGGSGPVLVVALSIAVVVILAAIIGFVR
jgi:hypothetical protein